MQVTQAAASAARPPVCLLPLQNGTYLSKHGTDVYVHVHQLAARGTKERARLEWPFFFAEKNILKTMMFRDVRTVLNEIKHLKMVIRSVPDSVSLILGRTE
jgi:hypothetical protein